ncbi:MAG: hypothetical protein HRT89_20145, partial [Lentisphaeria bacterium]|nr:hypothetical protein [Lentisphaeria bacterium]
MRDTLFRFNLDPSTQFCGGMSGGSVNSYSAARFNKERIGGILSYGGWLQNMYDPWFKYPKGLMVARGSGNNDRGANGWLKKDAAHLKKFKAKIKNWEHKGGHTVPPIGNIREMVKWLVATSGKPGDPEKAKTLAAKWAADPYSKGAINSMLKAITTKPKTYYCTEALKVLYKAMGDDEKFKKVTIPKSKSSAAALETYFGYSAYGAACVGDSARYHSAAYALRKLIKGNKKTRWHGILATFELFSPHESIKGDPKKVLVAMKPYGAKKAPMVNRMILAAAYLENGQKANAKRIAKGIKVQGQHKRFPK